MIALFAYNIYIRLKMGELIVMVQFIIDGKIRGKARPRFSKNGHCFKVKADSIYEKKIRDAFIEAGGVKTDKYVKMTLNMHFAIPKSYTKKRKKACLEGLERPAKKPDV